MEWQPIETAPKGVQILLSDGGDSTVGYWNGIVHRWIDACDENGFTFSRPTHWQPLPIPPAAEEG